MKSDSGHDFRIDNFYALSTCLACSILLLVLPAQISAESRNDTVAKPPALQERLRREKASGPIFVAIPFAYRYGIGGENTWYCSPSIRATNSSNAVVEELIIGIDYMNEAGKSVGKTITRYIDLKIRHQETNFFYQLTVADCKGIEGRMSIVRCVYSTGEDCSSSVQAVDFGAIPLRPKAR